jgi:hypothetical protein
MNQRSGLANSLIMFSPFLVMAPIAMCAWLDSFRSGASSVFSVLITLVGFGLFAAAKGSRFAGGHWFSLGTSGMAPWAHRLYLCGYACMAYGVVGLLFTQLTTH